MTSIDELRIYCEAYEQGLDFKQYIESTFEFLQISPKIKICYTSKNSSSDSIFSKLTAAKDYDLLISAISGKTENILLAVEYSAAVPTDDHIMQRADGQYWCAKYHVPYMKISPFVKRMGDDKNHGGGSNITYDFERFVALKAGIPYYKIEWESTKNNADLLEINKDRLSCISYNEILLEVLRWLIMIYISDGPSKFFEEAMNGYRKATSDLEKTYTLDKIKEIYPNSTRIRWDSDSVIVKINRFGHAMDPERGMVYFMNMLLGSEKVISEIQMQRGGLTSKGGYKSLYDGVPNEAWYLSDMRKICAAGNKISPEKALSLFLKATNLGQAFQHIVWTDNNTVELDNNELRAYLQTKGGLSHKFIFLLSKELILTDINRAILVKITYDAGIVSTYINSLNSTDNAITQIRKIEPNNIQEDLVTYASATLFNKSNITLLAVSYPGAQGDRCILIPQSGTAGRTVKRKYVDIIGYCAENSIIKLYLQENKAALKDSADDCKKLHELKDEKLKYIKEFVAKVGCNPDLDAIILGLGAKRPERMPAYDVDYIMTFDFSTISSDEIVWSVWICDTSLVNDFRDIKGDDGKLRGIMKIPAPLYIISKTK